MSISMKCFIDFSSLQSCYYRPTPCSRLITIQDRCKTSVLVMGKSQSRFEHIWDSTWGIMIRFEIMRFILWFYFNFFSQDFVWIIAKSRQIAYLFTDWKHVTWLFIIRMLCNARRVAVTDYDWQFCTKFVSDSDVDGQLHGASFSSFSTINLTSYISVKDWRFQEIWGFGIWNLTK